ncbi:endonuclease/exonuclease/phosphatase family protein [Streptomyces albiaxialis]|uniref:Endonuclease/exonuclease/phosphatase family protein n=1 Tax=Streptomyces albiaxialis TaxID=329523 RepID=A0ABN2VWY5_9ACTN
MSIHKHWTATAALALTAALGLTACGGTGTGTGTGSKDTEAARAELGTRAQKAQKAQQAQKPQQIQKAAGVVPNRVVTFNLHGPGKHRVKDQAAEIAKLRPAVFGTQETCGDKVDDFLKELKNRYGLEYYAYFKGFSHKVSQCGLFNNSYGQALFSVKPVRDYTGVKYEDSGHEGRGYVAVTTEIGGKDVRVFNTHLASKDDERDERASQVRQLEGEARKHNRAVVMGDFNAQQHWSELRPMYQHFTEADPYCGATYDGRCKPTFGKGKFDYVFLRRGAYGPPGVGVHDTPHSDHRIVHADIKAQF